MDWTVERIDEHSWRVSAEGWGSPAIVTRIVEVPTGRRDKVAQEMGYGSWDQVPENIRKVVDDAVASTLPWWRCSKCPEKIERNEVCDHIRAVHGR